MLQGTHGYYDGVSGLGGSTPQMTHLFHVGLGNSLGAITRMLDDFQIREGAALSLA